MKVIYTLLILFSFSVISQAQLPGEMFEVTIPAPSLSNNLFGYPSEMDIWIYLPPSYHEVDYAFPVVYYLKGGGPCGPPWASPAFVKEYRDRLDQDNLEEMIAVIISGCGASLYHSFYANSPVTGNWEDYVRYDIVNYVDSHYRTIRKSQCRGIGGNSTGGFGSISLAMRNPDIFNSLFTNSPSIYDNDYWANNQPPESEIIECVDYLESLKADDLETELNNLYNSFENQPTYVQYVVGYGAAFCPYPRGHVPFLRFPFSLDENRNLIKNDSISFIWDSCRSQWDKKIEFYADNFSSLDTLIFDYGAGESEAMKNAAAFFHNNLTLHNIEHSLIMHPGGHNDFMDRLHTVMFPAMSITLWRDSSRFRTGTEILAFEIDNQVQEAIIDPEKGAVEAFVSDTTNIEAIRSNIILSDGAWETPMARLELDFSWGPITFRVTSGDGQNSKLWTVTVTQISSSYVDLSEKDDLSIMPNPTSGIINISGLKQPAEAKIYSIHGKLIKSEHQITNRLDISELPSGVYFLNLIYGDIVWKKTFLKR